jgi:putative hydrolase of the HAD superfamily
MPWSGPCYAGRTVTSQVSVTVIAVPADVLTLHPSTIDAVVFDIGGVFTVRHHEVIGGALRPAGFEVPEGPAAYHRAHHDAVRAMSDLLRAQSTVNEYEPELWLNWERGYLRSLGVPAERMEEAVRTVVGLLDDHEIRTIWCQLLDENILAFHRIVAAGVPVAIVSNNNGTAEAQLRYFEICQAGPGPLPSVAIVVDSEVVGHSKPDPAIFAPALEALGTDPARTLYVGDTVHADVHGAQAAGMQVVQLDPYDLHTDFDHLRLPTVTALADLLLGPVGPQANTFASHASTTAVSS